MSIYDEMQGVASELFSEFQQGEIAYIGVTPGAGSPDAPGEAVEADPVPIDGTARGVSFKYIDNKNVFATDLQVNMPGAGVEPKMPGFITIDGKRAKIIQIVRKPAAGVPVAYTVIIRK